MNSTNRHQGLLTCARYAFPPNALHYCGPEQQKNLESYLENGITDQGLIDIVQDFQTLYPYLYLIAYENNIKDPFDPRVVEAYWIGNSLLKNVSIGKFYEHFKSALNLKKKLSKKDFDLIVGKLPDGILPHHSFHVLNVFTRTGHHTVEHTLDTMDKCRISWGTIINAKSPMSNDQLAIKRNTRHSEQVKRNEESIQITTKPLILENGKLTLGKLIKRTITIPYQTNNSEKVKLKENTLVTFHWDSLCTLITKQQAKQLDYYTSQAIILANKTI